MLILNSHKSHHSTIFELHCKKHNIITLYIPSHSSHYLQPLGVRCLGPMKKAYSRQIEYLMRPRITHVSKVKFLRAFREAFFGSMAEKSIQGGFRTCAARPGKGSFQTRVRIRTPTPTLPPSTSADPLIPKTPQNPLEANSPSELIKTCIPNHQNSSSTSMTNSVDKFANLDGPLGSGGLLPS